MTCGWNVALAICTGATKTHNVLLFSYLPCEASPGWFNHFRGRTARGRRTPLPHRAPSLVAECSKAVLEKLPATRGAVQAFPNAARLKLSHLRSTAPISSPEPRGRCRRERVWKKKQCTKTSTSAPPPPRFLLSADGEVAARVLLDSSIWKRVWVHGAVVEI